MTSGLGLRIRRLSSGVRAATLRPRALLVAGSVLLTIAGAGIAIVAVRNDAPHFDSAIWIRDGSLPCDSIRRSEQLAALERSGVLDRGTRTSRVFKALGQPDESETVQEGVVFFTYFTGSDGLDCTTLVIKMMENELEHWHVGQT